MKIGLISSLSLTREVCMQDTLTIEIPRPHTVSDLDTVRREAAEKAYRETVFDLIRQGEISSGYGADLLGTNCVDMIEQLRQQGIPVADYPVEASARRSAGSHAGFHS